MPFHLHVLNLRDDATSQDLRQLFSGLRIEDDGVIIIGGPDGEAFVTFGSQTDLLGALSKDGTENLTMKLATDIDKLQAVNRMCLEKLEKISQADPTKKTSQKGLPEQEKDTRPIGNPPGLTEQPKHREGERPIGIPQDVGRQMPGVPYVPMHGHPGMPMPGMPMPSGPFMPMPGPPGMLMPGGPGMPMPGGPGMPMPGMPMPGGPFMSMPPFMPMLGGPPGMPMASGPPMLMPPGTDQPMPPGTNQLMPPGTDNASLQPGPAVPTFVNGEAAPMQKRNVQKDKQLESTTQNKAARKTEMLKRHFHQTTEIYQTRQSYTQSRDAKTTNSSSTITYKVTSNAETLKPPSQAPRSPVIVIKSDESDSSDQPESKRKKQSDSSTRTNRKEERDSYDHSYSGRNRDTGRSRARDGDRQRESSTERREASRVRREANREQRESSREQRESSREQRGSNREQRESSRERRVLSRERRESFKRNTERHYERSASRDQNSHYNLQYNHHNLQNTISKQPHPARFSGSLFNTLLHRGRATRYNILISDLPEDVTARMVWSWVGGPQGQALGVILLKPIGDQANAFIIFENVAARNEAVKWSDKRMIEYSDLKTCRFISSIIQSWEGMEKINSPIFETTSTGADREIEIGDMNMVAATVPSMQKPVHANPSGPQLKGDGPPLIKKNTDEQDHAQYWFIAIYQMSPFITATKVLSWVPNGLTAYKINFYGEAGPKGSEAMAFILCETRSASTVAERDMRSNGYITHGLNKASAYQFMAQLGAKCMITETTLSGTDRPVSLEDRRESPFIVRNFYLNESSHMFCVELRGFDEMSTASAISSWFYGARGAARVLYCPGRASIAFVAFATKDDRDKGIAQFSKKNRQMNITYQAHLTGSEAISYLAAVVGRISIRISTPKTQDRKLTQEEEKLLFDIKKEQDVLFDKQKSEGGSNSLMQTKSQHPISTSPSFYRILKTPSPEEQEGLYVVTFKLDRNSTACEVLSWYIDCDPVCAVKVNFFETGPRDSEGMGIILVKDKFHRQSAKMICGQMGKPFSFYKRTALEFLLGRISGLCRISESTSYGCDRPVTEEELKPTESGQNRQLDNSKQQKAWQTSNQRSALPENPVARQNPSGPVARRATKKLIITESPTQSQKETEAFYVRLRKVPTDVTACEVLSWYTVEGGHGKSATLIRDANGVGMSAYIKFAEEGQRDSAISRQKFAKPCKAHALRVRLAELEPNYQVLESTAAGKDRIVTAEERSGQERIIIEEGRFSSGGNSASENGASTNPVENFSATAFEGHVQPVSAILTDQAPCNSESIQVPSMLLTNNMQVSIHTQSMSIPKKHQTERSPTESLSRNKHGFYIHLRKVPTDVTACKILSQYTGPDVHAKSAILVCNPNGVGISAYVRFDEEAQRDLAVPIFLFSKPCTMYALAMRLAELEEGYKIFESTEIGNDQLMTEQDRLSWKNAIPALKTAILPNTVKHTNTAVYVEGLQPVLSATALSTEVPQLRGHFYIRLRKVPANVTASMVLSWYTVEGGHGKSATLICDPNGKCLFAYILFEKDEHRESAMNTCQFAKPCTAHARGVCLAELALDHMIFESTGLTDRCLTVEEKEALRREFAPKLAKPN